MKKKVESESKFVRPEFDHFIDRIKQEAMKYGVELGFKRDPGMLAAVQKELKHWEEVCGLNFFEWGDTHFDCGCAEPPDTVQWARVRCLWALDTLLRPLDHGDGFPESIDMLDKYHSMLRRYAAKACGTPEIIGLEEFARRLGIGVSTAKNMFDPNGRYSEAGAQPPLRGIFVEQGKIRVDVQAFQERYRIRDRIEPAESGA